MKLKHLSLMALAAAALLASCAKEPMLDIEQNGDMIPLNISSSITQKHTKATAEGFVDKDALGLFAVNYTENNTVAGTLKAEGNQADNVKYVFDEANYKWNPVKAVYYKDVNTHADLYAYYPYQASIKDVNAANFEVKKDQSAEATATALSGYEASDFLWGKAEDITPTQSAIAISLSHKLSAVEVKLVEGTGFAKDEFASLEKSVILTNTTRKATIDYATGEATALGGPQLDGIVMCPQTDGSWRAIVIPQAISAGAQLFAITVNGMSYKFSRQEVVTYQAGKQMSFDITVNKKTPAGDLEFTLADTQITDWVEDRNTHGGEARQYFVVNVTEPGTLGETITAMGKNPDKIKNLKVLGSLSETDFYFMRDQMSALTSINLSEASPLGKEIASLYQGKYSPNYNDYVERYGIPDSDDGFYARWYDKLDGIIPQDALKNKSGLVHFIFPKNITEIEAGAFQGTNLSGALILPERLKEIGSAAFYGTLISSISFPGGLISINGFAFAYCNALTGTLTLPSSLQVIRSEAFQNCNFTGRLILPENLEIIENSAFNNAGSFDGDLIIPEKVKEIGGSAFYGSSFTGSLILNNVTKIGEFAFFECGFRGELVIPEGNLVVNDFTFYRSNFSSVVFPSTLIRIELNAFSGSYRLTKIEFQEGLVSIGQDAFASCNNLLDLDLPSTLQTIQSNAFDGCFYIHRIFCSAIEPPTVFEGAFNGVAKDNFTVEVPAQSVRRYQAESGWSDFNRIAAHYDFAVSRERMRALNAEQTRTYTLHVPANFSWSIQSKPDWVTVSPNHGTGKTDVTISVSEMARTSSTFEVNEGTYNNPEYKQYKGRSGEIIFQLDEKGVDYTCSFEVEQYDSDYSDGEKAIIQTHSKGNGIDIVFVGDGYDAKDIAKETFISNVNEGYEAFFNVEPYKTYKDYFNVYAVVTQSDDSGIGTVNTVIDTKFGTYFTQNRINVPESEPLFSWARKANAGIDFKKALVITLLNTSTYEGITAMYADGSAIAYCPVSRDAYPYDFRGIIQHEAGGHGFGKLGDEYIYHNAFIQTCDCGDCDHPMGDDDTASNYGKFKSLGWFKNLSMVGDMHQVPWTHLIYNPQYSNYVDMYEGGYMHSRGVYRSEATSCMNNNIPYYSAISRQAIVERIKYCAGETFDLEDFYAKDKDTFGDITRGGYVPIDCTFGVDPMWNRGSEEGSVVYMGEHPDYGKIK